MTDLQFIEHGTGRAKSRIAVKAFKGDGPRVVFFGGLHSNMESTKASIITEWAQNCGNSFVRFDYSGHGRSDRVFEECTLSDWLGDSIAVLKHFDDQPTVLIGSSMGAWLVLLALRALPREGLKTPKGIILIAPATDFTERLLWDRLDMETRKILKKRGKWVRSSDRGPITLTSKLIDDGRNHLLLDHPIHTGCPVRILQGMEDTDVPWQHAVRLIERLAGESASLTLIKGGDHSLSRPREISLLLDCLTQMVRLI
ncbi:MAG: alpha/beta hydrolase [Hyphomicrobiales bacterium]